MKEDDFHRDPFIQILIKEDLISGESSLKKGRYWIKKEAETKPVVSEEPQRTEPLSQFEAEILSNIFDKNKK